jgi:hypothetical protein
VSLSTMLLRGFGSTATAVPTLTVVDNGDGSGAVATIAGSAVGSSNTVYGTNWPDVAWASKGSRTGNGTVALSVAVGPWWFYVKSVDTEGGGGTADSAIVHVLVTDGTQSVLFRILQAARTLIRNLALPGVTSAGIEYQKLPWDRSGIKPGIWIYPVKESPKAGTNERSDLEYPIEVVFARVSNQNLTDSMETFTDWRQRLRHAFTPKSGYRPIADVVSEVYSTRVEPGETYWPTGFTAQHDVGSLRVICTSREVPGATA